MMLSNPGFLESAKDLDRKGASDPKRLQWTAWDSTRRRWQASRSMALTDDREETAGNGSGCNEAEDDDSQQGSRALGICTPEIMQGAGRHDGGGE